MEEHCLSWGLCVATLNRVDMLAECVRHALAQTRQPAEIAIADASDDWEAHRDFIAKVIGEAPVKLFYIGHEAKSSAVQRNTALLAMSADIAFVIDDDSLMEPDCAETIMALYEADAEGRIAGISGTNVASEQTPSGMVDLKDKGGLRQRKWVQQALKNSALARWVLRDVLMQSRDRIFVKYDDPATHHGPETARRLNLPGTRYTEFLPGWGMTVRREVALKEPFDAGLLAYCPTEDLDTSYRWGRHGVNLLALNARIAHVEVAAGRIKRQKVTALSVMNSAYFTRRNSDRPIRHAAVYYMFTVRRVIAELLKDLLMARFALPQTRGALRGLAHSPAIFRQDRAEIVDWYKARQKKILAG